jgi:O-antigen ligase
MFKFIYQNIIGLFIGLLPIYWFPGISHDILNHIKNAIYLLTFVYIISNTRFPKTININILIIIIFVDLLLLLPSLIQSSAEYYLTVFKEFFIPIVITVISLGLNKSKDFFLDQLIIGTKVFSLFLFIGLYLFYFSPFDLAPSELFNGETREVMFIRGSFSGSSTSWGMFCSFYFIIAAILCKLKKMNFIYLFIYFLTVLISVVITGSRSAQLVLVLVFIVYNITEYGISSFLISFSIFISIFFLIYNISGLDTDSLRILNFRNAAFDDDFSSGRSDDFQKSIYQIGDNPVFGSGYGFIEGKFFHTGNVHNTILRQIVTYGFFFFLVLYSELLCYLYLIFWRLKFQKFNNFKSSHLLLILMVGLLPISLVEPFVLFGLGLMNLPIWFLFAALYKYGGN